MVRGCKDCPDRVISVDENGIYLCRTHCRDWKIRKLEEQHIKNKKIKADREESAFIEQIIKQRKHAGRKFGHKIDNNL